jgi:hypothetical protein
MLIRSKLPARSNPLCGVIMVGCQWILLRGKGDSGAQWAGWYSVLRGVYGLNEWQQQSQLMADVRKSSIFIRLKNTGTLNATGYLVTVMPFMTCIHHLSEF